MRRPRIQPYQPALPSRPGVFVRLTRASLVDAADERSNGGAKPTAWWRRT
jgi:hypothetical protein